MHVDDIIIHVGEYHEYIWVFNINQTFLSLVTYGLPVSSDMTLLFTVM